MTVQSFTDSSKSYETTETTCSCKSFYFSKKPCKHMIALQINKDETFAQLFARYDVRANGTEQSRRCYLELATCSY